MASLLDRPIVDVVPPAESRAGLSAVFDGVHERARGLPRAITLPFVHDGVPGRHPVAMGCLLPRCPLLGGDPALAQRPPRLMKGLPGEAGHTLQGVVDTRRRRARCRGRLERDRRDLCAEPIEEWLQRIDGQQEGLDLLTGQLQSDRVVAGGFM
jgi:hypothetical protein